MIHYHGTPISPVEHLYALAGRNFCVSYAAPGDLRRCHEIGQSVMLDNGAFTAWTQGRAVDWALWEAWAAPWLDHQTTWCVLPDSIDGGEEENNRLVDQFHLVPRGAPVWHMHESLDRLLRLAMGYERVCFGSSGQYAIVGDERWHQRATEAFNVLADQDGRVRVWVHMLRGMSLSGSHYPFASVDSTDIARNHNREQNTPRLMADRWDALQCPARWSHIPMPTSLFEEAL